MTFTAPTANTYNSRRTVTRDAKGRRVVVKAAANTNLLSIVVDRTSMTLTQDDAAQLAQLLTTYAEHGTIG